MSLIRTALRLAAVPALLEDPVLDALCEGRVYDSRIGDFTHREPVPVIILTTEEAKGDALSANNGGPPFRTHCDLVLEIAMNAVTKVRVEGSTEPIDMIAAPETDPELEADLDLIEERALDVLLRGSGPAARLLHDAVLKRAPEVRSSRFATDQAGERVAIRLVTLRVELKNEGTRNALSPPEGPFAAFPEPLRRVAEALPADSYGGRICRRLAGRLPAPVAARPVAGTTFTLGAKPAPIAGSSP